ncbi:hypothetical protein [Bacillus sp. NPDC094106]|uniref:hypothetical protein n=1 Tax=Bacillus sp. NPDC094106 TaxID=3363949 RepID=UPI00381A24E2
MTFEIATNLSKEEANSVDECIAKLKDLHVIQSCEVKETGLDVAMMILNPGGYFFVEDNQGNEIKVTKLK